MFSPQLRSLGLALGEAGYPVEAIGLAGRNLPRTREPRELHPLEEENIRSQIAQRQRPAAPRYVDLGGHMAEISEGQEPRLFEKTPAPAKPETQADREQRELQRRNVESQIRSRETTTQISQARETRIRQAQTAATDPKATAEKLTTMYNALLRDRQNEFDETKLEEINTILDTIRSRIATLVKSGNAPQSSVPQSPTGAGGMPPAAQHKDRVIRDTTTGKRYRSDGSQWLPIEGGAGEY
jgi:hypothetical protein